MKRTVAALYSGWMLVTLHLSPRIPIVFMRKDCFISKGDNSRPYPPLLPPPKLADPVVKYPLYLLCMAAAKKVTTIPRNWCMAAPFIYQRQP